MVQTTGEAAIDRARELPKFGAQIQRPKFYRPEKRDEPIVFLPLRRTEAPIRARNGSESYVWGCELLADYVLSLDKQPAVGRAGEFFLMYEPSDPLIIAALSTAVKHGYALQLYCDGKKPIFLQSQNATRDVWQWRVHPSERSVKSFLAPSAILLPAPSDKLEESNDDVPF